MMKMQTESAVGYLQSSCECAVAYNMPIQLPNQASVFFSLHRVKNFSYTPFSS